MGSLGGWVRGGTGWEGDEAAACWHVRGRSLEPGLNVTLEGPAVVLGWAGLSGLRQSGCCAVAWCTLHDGCCMGACHRWKERTYAVGIRGTGTHEVLRWAYVRTRVESRIARSRDLQLLHGVQDQRANALHCTTTRPHHHHNHPSTQSHSRRPAPTPRPRSGHFVSSLAVSPHPNPSHPISPHPPSGTSHAS